MLALLIVLLLGGGLIGAPPLVRLVFDDFPEMWWTAPGTVRAVVLLLGAVVVAGWAAIIGELAGAVAGVVWLISGQARLFLADHPTLRGQILTSLAASPPGQSLLRRYLQLYLLVALGSSATERRPAATNVTTETTTSPPGDGGAP